MTHELTISISPAEALERVRRLFLEGPLTSAAYLIEESEVHLTLGTFRNRVAVSAFPDPDGSERTRVRISSLRPDDTIGKILAHLGVAP